MFSSRPSVHREEKAGPMVTGARAQRGSCLDDGEDPSPPRVGPVDHVTEPRSRARERPNPEQADRGQDRRVFQSPPKVPEAT